MKKTEVPTLVNDSGNIVYIEVPDRLPEHVHKMMTGRSYNDEALIFLSDKLIEWRELIYKNNWHTFQESLQRSKEFRERVNYFGNKQYENEIHYSDIRRVLFQEFRKTVEVDRIYGEKLKSRFFPFIDEYTNWYNERKNDPSLLSKEYSSFAEQLYWICNEIKVSILKYFPDDKPSEKLKRQNEPTAGQVALFVFYLVKGKIEREPTKSEWKGLLNKYKFHKSPLNVRNHYIAIGKCKKKPKDPMNRTDLVYVIDNLLTKYEAAKVIAEKDFYEMEKELQR